ncbi:MAG: hypothetical protein ABIH42_10930 [Planctomycetota bacterium]
MQRKKTSNRSGYRETQRKTENTKLCHGLAPIFTDYEKTKKRKNREPKFRKKGNYLFSLFILCVNLWIKILLL